MKKLFNIITTFFKRVFTPVNLSKVLVIFFVGFISRYLINDYFSINVFTEYLTLISVTFYSIFATFVVFIHEYFSFFNISIIPNFIWNILSKLGLALKYFFVESFTWIYSKTWGKNVPILYMNNSRTSSSVYVSNEHHNHSSVNRIPHPSHYYDPNHDAQSYTDEYVDHNTSSLYSNYYQTCANNYQEDNKYFCIDSINENGVDRNFYTPSNAPGAPEMSNATTPSTMTPLFGSSEQVNQYPNQYSTSSLAFTNNTNHGTIGQNRSQDHVNWPARSHNLFRAMQVEAQFLKEEIRVPSPKIKGKVSLGIEFIDSKSNIQSLYVKYHDLAKRKFFWNIWEKGRDNYDSYEEFKKNFDPKMNIWKEIAKVTKSEVSKEIRSLLDTDPFKTKQPKIDTRNIRKVGYTRSQAQLNHVGLINNRAASLPRK